MAEVRFLDAPAGPKVRFLDEKQQPFLQALAKKAAANKQASGGVDVMDETSRVLSQMNETYAGALGFPVDAANWLLGGIGLDSEKPFMGSDWLREQSRDIGLSKENYAPQTDIGRYAAAGLGGAGAAMIGAPMLGGGIMAAGRAMGSPAVAAAGQATMAAPVADALAGAGAGVGGQAAQDIAPGNKYAELAGQLVGAMVPGGIGNFARTAANPVIKAMDNVGIDPTMGTAGGRTAAYVQNNALAQTGGASGVVDNAISKTLAQTDAAAKQIADAYGQPLPGQFAAGAQLQKDLTDWFDRVKKGTGRVYDDIANQFRPGEVFQASNTQNMLRNPAGKFDSADLGKLLADPEIAKLAKAVEASGGNLSYNDMKLFRSNIGAKLDPRMVGNIDQKQLKDLYGALSDDLAAAVGTRGTQVAHRWRTTNALYASAMEKFKDQFERLVGKGGPVPAEQAYKLLVGSGEKDFSRFREIWGVLTPAQRGNYAATMLSEMGRQKGVFSVTRFLTEYGNLSEQAKALLFRSTGNGQAQAALDDLLTAARAIDKNTAKTASTSRSGASVPMLAQAGGVYKGIDLINSGQPTAGVMVMLSSVGGPWAAAKLMTNPAATRALAWALRASKAGGKAAAKATAILQSFGMPEEPKEPLRITVPNPNGAQP